MFLSHPPYNMAPNDNPSVHSVLIKKRASVISCDTSGLSHMSIDRTSFLLLRDEQENRAV